MLKLTALLFLCLIKGRRAHGHRQHGACLGRSRLVLVGHPTCPPLAADASPSPPASASPTRVCTCSHPKASGAFHTAHLPNWDTSSNWEVEEGRARHRVQQHQTGRGSTQHSVSFLHLQDRATKAVNDSALIHIFAFFQCGLQFKQSQMHTAPSQSLPLFVHQGSCASASDLTLLLCCLCIALVSAPS